MSQPADTATGSLLFVYAADSGFFNTVADIAHKIFSPDTYQCDLCALTHGHFRVKDEWLRFMGELGMPCRFLHRDQVSGMPDIDSEFLPAIYRYNGSAWVMCLSPNAIGRCRDLAQLKERIKEHCLE
jgi:hypothetical protein